MDAVGRRPGSRLRPEPVPKPVAGRAFTVMCKARSLSEADRSRKDPSRPPVAPSRPGYRRRRDGVAGRADAVGV
jgi:hypothetical protein